MTVLWHSQTAIIDCGRSVKMPWFSALAIMFWQSRHHGQSGIMTGDSHADSVLGRCYKQVDNIPGISKVQEAAKQHMTATAKSNHLRNNRTRTCAAAPMTNS